MARWSKRMRRRRKIQHARRRYQRYNQRYIRALRQAHRTRQEERRNWMWRAYRLLPRLLIASACLCDVWSELTGSGGNAWFIVVDLIVLGLCLLVW